VAGLGSDNGEGVALTPSGAIYVGGHFLADSAVFWQGQPDERVVPSGGNPNLFVARLAPSGALEWLLTGGTVASGGVDVLATLGESVFVAGSHRRTAPDPPRDGGLPTETRLPVDGLFLARYQQDGTLVWAKGIGGNFGDIQQIAVAPQGEVALGGFASRTLVFGPGEPNQTRLVNEDTNVNDDAFVARFGAAGDLQWALQIRGADRDRVDDVQIAADGSVVVLGTFYGTPTFPSRDGATVTLTAEGGDLFLARYESNGNLRWLRRTTGPSHVEGLGLALLPDGQIAVSGMVITTLASVPLPGRAVLGPGEPRQTVLEAQDFDMFLARYDADGRLVWARLAPGAHAGRHSVLAAPSGEILVAGTFGNYGIPPRETAVLGPGEPGEITLGRLPGADHMNTFLAWYRGDGTIRTARIVGQSDTSMVRGASLTAEGGVVFTGSFIRRMVFGPLDSAPITYFKTGPTLMSNVFTQDIYVAAFRP
jgi:hypothetical protein